MITDMLQDALRELEEVGKKVHSLFLEKLSELSDDTLSSIFDYLGSYWFDRDRTALIWYSNQIVGGKSDHTLAPSLVMSLTSSGMGIHDDIIDKTRIKYLKKTVPAAFTSEKALIAGDLLLVKGLLSTRHFLAESDIETYGSMMGVLDEYFTSMAVAEIRELSINKDLTIELDEYLELLWGLGVDGCSCAVLGAVSGDASDDEKEVLGHFGQTLGYIVRLRDEIRDILNYDGNLNNRIQYESIPLALLYCAKQNPKFFSEISEIIMKDMISSEDVATLLKICYEAGSFPYINDLIESASCDAVKRLSVFPDSHAKKMLVLLLEIKKDQKELVY